MDKVMFITLSCDSVLGGKSSRDTLEEARIELKENFSAKQPGLSVVDDNTSNLLKCGVIQDLLLLLYQQIDILPHYKRIQKSICYWNYHIGIARRSDSGGL